MQPKPCGKKIRDQAEDITPQQLDVRMISAQTLRVCREEKPLYTFSDHVLSVGRLWLAVDPLRRDHGIDGDHFLFEVTALQAFERSVLKSLRPFRNSRRDHPGRAFGAARSSDGQ
jgi:hypothetical protein